MKKPPQKNTNKIRRRSVPQSKNTKRGKGVYYAIAVLFFIIAAAAFFIARNNIENARMMESGAKIYFYDAQSRTLKPEYRTIAGETNAEKVKFVLEELAIGPKGTSLTPSLPQDILHSASVSGDNVDVRVTKNYAQLKIDEEMLARTALVHSLTDLPFVETVTINIEGNGLLKPNGQPVGAMRSSDIVMAPEINPQGTSPKTLTLYFANESLTGLVAETRTVYTNPNELPARYVVNEIIDGPATSGLLPTVSPETKLLEINISDGVCNVDLSREFISKHANGEGTEHLAIYSIVNSLAEQSDIKNVQFLIEGKRQEQFGAETGFNNLYEAREIPIAGE